MNLAATTDNPTYDERHARRVLLVTCMAAFIAFIDVTIVNTAFPDIARSFPDASLSSLSWVVNAYTILFAALLLPAGRIADLVGRKRVFIIGIAVFTVASAVAAAAPSLEFLVAARLVQGSAAALMVPTSMALLLPAFPRERQPVAIGLWGATNSVAAAIGPALGGALVSIADWRLVFLVNVPVGIAAVFAAQRFLREQRGAAGGKLPDLAGTAALASGSALVVLAIVEGNSWGWTSATTLACIAGGIALAATAILRSRTHERPAIEISLWRVPGMSIVNLGSLLSGVTFFSFFLGGTLFVTSVWHYSVFEAGLSLTPGAISCMFVAPLAGALASRIGERWIIVAGSAVMAGANYWLATNISATPDFVGLWLPAGLVAGVGIGLLFPALASAAVRDMPPQKLGSVIALNMTARQLGGALGVAGLIALITSSTGSPVDLFSDALTMGSIAVALIVPFFLMPSRRERTAPSSEATAIRPMLTAEHPIGTAAPAD
ncbi:MAG: MFS transporter, partial [Solirubrobacterales bacterium]